VAKACWKNGLAIEWCTRKRSPLVHLWRSYYQPKILATIYFGEKRTGLHFKRTLRWPPFLYSGLLSNSYLTKLTTNSRRELRA
jgi:hypothetical protein